MDFTTAQTLDQRALAQIVDSANRLYSANARGETATEQPAFWPMLEAIKTLCRDCDELPDAIDNWLHVMKQEAEQPRTRQDIIDSYRCDAAKEARA